MATPPSSSTPVTSDQHQSSKQVTQRPNKYADIDDIIINPNINKVVWTNEMLKDRKVINLDAWSDAEKRIGIIKEVLTCLTVQVSTRSVGALMVCAWGLVSSENPNKSVFDGLWECSKARELEEYISLPDGRTSSSRRNHDQDWIKFASGNRTLNWMRTASFYCAAVLRLITKEHDALVNAWSHLPEHYQRFYQTPMEFNISLDHECLKSVRFVFQNRPIIRNSVAPFLLAFQEVNGEKNRGICEKLFEIHMRYTGLHAYTLFISNASKLGVPYDVFISLLRRRDSKEGLETIKKILEDYESPRLDEGDKKSKCTWIYSRIFDSDMFDSLQTKNCTFLAALLAVIADTTGASGSGQATKIKQLEWYIGKNKDNLHLWAGRIIAACNKFNEEERTKKFV